MIDAGRTSDGLPFLRAGHGPRTAVLLFGAGALFEPLDRSPHRGRYIGIAARLLPGFSTLLLGYHVAPPVPYTLDVVARDVARSIDETVGRPELLLGLSFGGFVALRVAAVRPDLAARLVLLSSAHRFSTAGLERLHRQALALQQGDVAELVLQNAALFRRPWLNWLIRSRLAWEGRHRIVTRLNPVATLARGYGTLFGDTFGRTTDLARRIAAPTLVVGGTADQYFDADAFRETAGLVERGETALFERETHMLVLERERDVRDAIARFAGSRRAG